MSASRTDRASLPLGLALGVLWTGCAAGLPRLSYQANPRVLALPAVVIHQDSSGGLSYHAPSGRDAQRLLPRGRWTLRLPALFRARIAGCQRQLAARRGSRSAPVRDVKPDRADGSGYSVRA